MADWNTSSSRGKSSVQRFLDDPRKVTVAVAAMGCFLLAIWALSFLDGKEEPEAAAVAFSLPDPAQALPRPESGFSLAKAPADKVEAAEVDALKALQAEAEKDVSDSPAPAAGSDEAEEEAEDADVPVEGEDERGAPGRPIAEQAGFFAGGGGAGGGGGFVPSAGGVGGNGSSGASSAGGAGPNAGAADGGPGARQVQGAASSGRTLTASGRTLRSGTAGTTSGAAGAGLGEGFNKFAPTGASGSVYGAGPGVNGGSPVGGAGAGTGGGGAGLRNEGGGGGVADGAPGGNPEAPGGGGGVNPPDGPDGPGGPGGPGAPVTPKKRKEVEQDAAEVLKTAKSYRTNVVVKIMAQEKADVTQVAARSKQANSLLKADVKALQKVEAKLAAFPAAAAALSDGRLFIEDHSKRFLDGGTDLTKAAKVISKVPAQCTTKAEHATAQEDGTEVDPKGVLQAHRDAVSALKRVALARVAVGEYQAKFAAEWPAHEAAVRAADPKLANAYKKAAADLDKDLKKIVASLPPTLYPTKGKGKAAKRDMAKKLKPIREKNAAGLAEFKKRQDEIKAAHRAYPDTADLKKAEDSSWLAVEGASQVDGPDAVTGQNLLTAAESFLPSLVQAGENAAEAYMESCDQWAAMKRLAKDAPK